MITKLSSILFRRTGKVRYKFAGKISRKQEQYKALACALKWFISRLEISKDENETSQIKESIQACSSSLRRMDVDIPSYITDTSEGFYFLERVSTSQKDTQRSQRFETKNNAVVAFKKGLIRWEKI